MTTATRTLVALLVAVPLLAGCGGGLPGGSGKDLADVESCLKDESMAVKREKGTKDQPQRETVFATTDLAAEGTDPSQGFTVAVAAELRSEKDVESFKAETKKFVDQLDEQQQQAFDLQSGNEGDYVWATAGEEGSDQLAAVVECVKP